MRREPQPASTRFGLDFHRLPFNNFRMAQVVLEHLTKVFQGPGGESVRAVDDACLAVEDKELLVLVGPSGCGKTTTLRLIAGLEEPTAGTIAINGQVVNQLPPKDRDIAMVFQNYALYPHMSVYENMAFGLKLRHYPRDGNRAAGQGRRANPRPHRLPRPQTRRALRRPAPAGCPGPRHRPPAEAVPPR